MHTYLQRFYRRRIAKGIQSLNLLMPLCVYWLYYNGFSSNKRFNNKAFKEDAGKLIELNIEIHMYIEYYLY